MIYTATVTRDGQVVAELSRPDRPYGQSDANDYPGCVLVAEGVEYAGLAEPTLNPLTTVREGLAAAEKLAAERILDLKTNAAVALVAGGMTGEEAYSAGSALVLQHANLIQAYILAGGNPVSKSALIAAIEANPPAWWSEQMATLFTTLL